MKYWEIFSVNFVLESNHIKYQNNKQVTKSTKALKKGFFQCYFVSLFCNDINLFGTNLDLIFILIGDGIFLSIFELR